MNINTYIPVESLRPYILTYIIVESEDGLANRVLPDTSLVLAFRFKGRLSYTYDGAKNEVPFATLSGIRKSPRLYNYSINTGNILVLFKEAGAAAFFKIPLHQLYDDCVPLDNFLNHQKISMIEEQLAEAKDNAQRIDLVERFLLSELSDYKPDNLILSALQMIHSVKGNIRIKELADSLYISHDAFEKRFRRVAGTSPKQFSSLIRLKSITDGGRQKPNLIELAFDTGYFDQAHFNKDFKLFTGQTPTDFFKFPSFLQITDFLQ